MQMNKIPFWGIPQPRQRAPSMVRSIPVHFVGSERNGADSATKIQKVLRGYLVRRSVKKMIAMKVELEKFENMVNAPETVVKMRMEKKERLRVGESIMNLLLRLDSVKVLNCSALRDCRKSLIKRAIALQEMVDQIEGVPDHDQPQRTQEVGDSGNSVADSSEIVAAADSAGEKIETLGAEEGKCVMGTSLAEGDCLVKEEEGEGGCEEHEEDKKIETLSDEEKMEEVEGKVKVGVEENCLVKEEEGQSGEKIGTLSNEEKMEEVEEKEKEGVEENCLVKEEEGEGRCEDHGDGEKIVTSRDEGKMEENCLVEEEEGEEVGCEEEKEKDCEGGNRELLKRMMKDNEKMMGMMAQLFERNEKQTKLLCSLTQRVEMLERAFACYKLRRKKRRNADAKCKGNDPKNGCC